MKYKLDEEGRILRIDPNSGKAELYDATPEELSGLILKASPQGPIFTQPRPYSSLIAEEFCFHLSSGKTTRKACKAANLEYQEYLRWLSLSEKFRALVAEATKNRAEEVFDRLLEVAETTGADQDEVALGRLKADIYKHVAAVTDDRFVATQKVKADHRVGIVSLDTGIRRPGDTGYEEPTLFGELDQKLLEEKGKKG